MKMVQKLLINASSDKLIILLSAILIYSRAPKSLYAARCFCFAVKHILPSIGTNFVCNPAGERFPAVLPVFQAIFGVACLAANAAISSSVGMLTMGFGQAAEGGIFRRILCQTILQVSIVSADGDIASGFVKPYLGQLILFLDSCNHFVFHLISDRIFKQPIFAAKSPAQDRLNLQISQQKRRKQCGDHPALSQKEICKKLRS